MFCSLLRGLPEDALTRRPPGQTQVWTRTLELLTALVEVTSISASGHRLRKPVTLPRPTGKRSASAAALTIQQAMGMYASMNRIKPHSPRAGQGTPDTGGQRP